MLGILLFSGSLVNELQMNLLGYEVVDNFDISSVGGVQCVVLVIDMVFKYVDGYCLELGVM